MTSLMETDGADAGLPQVSSQHLSEQTAGEKTIPRTDLQPGVDERTEHPRPDRSLMIGSVTTAEISSISGMIDLTMS
jgi:hypothetical protein